MIIYKATNVKNGKVYIGLTTKTLEHRKRIHERDSRTKDTYFYRAMRKYGPESFTWEVLDDSAKTIEELEELERFYIKQYDSFDNKDKGYNTQSGGNSLYQITEEERKNRSERVKGEKNPMYGVPSPNKGKHLSEEHRNKISEALKGRVIPSIIGENNYNARKVRNITTGEIFNTITEASKAYETSRTNIGRACRTGMNAKGCKWEYLNNTVPSSDEEKV